jgi:hypothetical protein
VILIIVFILNFFIYTGYAAFRPCPVEPTDTCSVTNGENEPCDKRRRQYLIDLKDYESERSKFVSPVAVLVLVIGAINSWNSPIGIAACLSGGSILANEIFKNWEHLGDRARILLSCVALIPATLLVGGEDNI